MGMKKPVAVSEQEIAVAVRAAAYVRWVELREKRSPRDEERYEWIRTLLASDDLRSLDSDVFKIDKMALVLEADGVMLWAKDHKYFEALDEVRRGLDDLKDEIKKEVAADKRTGD
jgi:hypothetical protein